MRSTAPEVQRGVCAHARRRPSSLKRRSNSPAPLLAPPLQSTAPSPSPPAPPPAPNPVIPRRPAAPPAAPLPRPAAAVAAPPPPARREPAPPAVSWPTPGEEFWKRPQRAAVAGRSASSSPPRDAHPLRVAHVSCELAPYAKVGGLADAVSGLALACLARGHDVLVVLPHYTTTDATTLEGMTFDRHFDVPRGRMEGGALRLTYVRYTAHTAIAGGVPVALLRPEHDLSLFQKPYGYGLPECESAVVFCRAALEYLAARREPWHVLHCHEWQAGAVPMLYWELGFRAKLHASLVLTIHNADSEGFCRTDQFAASGTAAAPFMTEQRALDERTKGHNPERMSLLKGGIVYSNAVTTVSQTYRTETVSAGWLGRALSLHAQKYSGVVNGLDVDIWDPAQDRVIPIQYDATTWVAGKAAAKRFLQLGLGLPADPLAPLVVAVSRLVAQKGTTAMMQAACAASPSTFQFVLLGTGSSDGPFRDLAARNPESARLLLFYDEPLSRLCFAAADVCLVPSAFEPCGLVQLIGQRYGAPPLVRRTGGLADTVAHRETGFVYDAPEQFMPALEDALRVFRTQPKEWAALVERAMHVDSGA